MQPLQAMNSLILLVDNDSSWSPLVWAAERGGEPAEDGRTVVAERRGWLAIHHDPNVLDDFAHDEKAEAVAALVDPAIFVVEWEGNQLVESFVRAVPLHCRVYVDNDRGLFAPVTLLRDLPFGAWARAVALQ